MLSIILIGCASHRFAPETAKFSHSFRCHLEKMDGLFTQRYIAEDSNSNTALRPLRRNSTRWWSTNAMLKRLFQYIDRKSFDLFDESFTQFVSSLFYQQTLETLMKQYKTIHVITLYYRRESNALHEIPASLALFWAQEKTLNNWTNQCCVLFKNEVEETDIEEDDGDDGESEESDVTNFEGTLESIGNPTSQLVTNYFIISNNIDLKCISGTSGVLERLFSRLIIH
ncbi:hypothetical protein GEMRC1_013989 [Eukaryota sp. GEM-RC1]